MLPRAQDLAKQGAEVISVFGSSITFYKGAKFHDDLIQQVAKATGKKATTQSNGLLDGLRTANAKRVAVATAYTDIVTERLKIFLQEYGFEVTSAKGLGFERIPGRRGDARHSVQTKHGCLQQFEKSRCARRFMRRIENARADRAGGKVIKVPVISSTPHGLWHGVKMLGVKRESRATAW